MTLYPETSLSENLYQVSFTVGVEKDSFLQSHMKRMTQIGKWNCYTSWKIREEIARIYDLTMDTARIKNLQITKVISGQTSKQENSDEV